MFALFSELLIDFIIAKVFSLFPSSMNPKNLFKISHKRLRDFNSSDNYQPYISKAN